MLRGPRSQKASLSTHSGMSPCEQSAAQVHTLADSLSRVAKTTRMYMRRVEGGLRRRSSLAAPPSPTAAVKASHTVVPDPSSSLQRGVMVKVQCDGGGGGGYGGGSVVARGGVRGGGARHS